jgi:hypothetical protein
MFHIVNDLVNKFVLLKQTCNWPARLTLEVPFALNKPIVTSFGSQSKVKKLMIRANVSLHLCSSISQML